MGFPVYTYTFSNSTTADATQVNQDFTDILNGVSDGTKNINVSAGTFGGTLTANGSVTLGTSSSNNLTVNASLASSIPVGTTYSYDIGSSTIGLRSIYLGSSDSAAHATRVIGATTTGWTLTLPTGAGTNLQLLQTDGTGVSKWDNLHGTTTNDNASAGYVGEYVESLISSTTWSVASASWGDATSISLTAGDWMVYFVVSAISQAASGLTNLFAGISQTTGNSATGLTEGQNMIEWDLTTALPSGSRIGLTIPGYRQSLSGTTTIYGKVKMIWATTNPLFLCRLCARRVR